LFSFAGALVIEVRHLRYFVVVAEELHFGRAAERLRMAQSALSQQVRQLEGEIGVELIDRGHRVVGLTDAGQTFLRGAKAILEELDHAVQLTRRASRGEVGTIVVGYVGEVTANLVPLSMKAYKDRFPAIEIDLLEGTTGELLDALRRRQLDVAFVRHPGAVDDLEYEQLVEEPLFVALPSGHALAGQRRPLADLSGEPFVLPSSPIAQGLRRDIDTACSTAGFVPHASREASPLSAVLLHVAAGAGVALVPASLAHGYQVPGVGFARLDPPPMTHVGMAWRQRDRSQIVGDFLEITRRMGAEQSEILPERQ
jgi:DNA-binding transcriptional LysR family regulator